MIAAARSFFLPRVVASYSTVAAFQKACGVKDGKPTNPYLNALFTFGAALGNELTFILFLPYLFWEFDVVVARRLIVLWGIVYFLGQSLKDLLELPRPGKPAIHLETQYQAEYGLPSTHAMNSCSMPWFVVLESWDRLNTVQDRGLLVSIALFCPWDVGVGATLGAVSTALLYAVIKPLDALIVTSPVSPLVVLIVAVALLYYYPKPKTRWVNSPGDCAIILGVVSGVILGVRCSYDPTVSSTGLIRVIYSLPRCLVGFGLLFLTRAVMKPVGLAIMTSLFPSTPSRPEPPERRYEVELPTKILTYSCVGFNAVFFAPLLFMRCGLCTPPSGVCV